MTMNQVSKLALKIARKYKDAELALPYAAKGENRPAECIAVVRRWIAGDASIDKVMIARRAAAYAADAADARKEMNSKCLAIVREKLKPECLKEKNA